KERCPKLNASHDLHCVFLTVGGAGQPGRRSPDGLERLQQVGAANLAQRGNARYWEEMQLVEMQQAQESDPEHRHQSDPAETPRRFHQLNNAIQRLRLILEMVPIHVLVLRAAPLQENAVVMV